MIPVAFEYFVPHSVEEAITRLAGCEPGAAAILAGGMSLLPTMKLRIAMPAMLVDIGRLRELAGISHASGRLCIGALTSHAELLSAPELVDFPVFAETACVLGDPQVRNRGTFGGSLVQAHPAADWPAVFLALRGEAHLRGPRGERSVRSEDFFTGMLTTAVAEGEVLTRISFPVKGERSGAAYSKMRQQASGMALAGVAAQVTLDEAGHIEETTVAVTGINGVPFRAGSIEQHLRGAPPLPSALQELCADVPEADPVSDPHADAEYRRQLLSVHAARALARALSRAQSAATARVHWNGRGKPDAGRD